MRRKTAVSIFVAVIIAVFGFLIAGALSTNASSNTASNSALLGEYSQVEGDVPAFAHFTASVSDSKIQIDIRLDGTPAEGDADPAGIYWTGTFDTSNTSDTFTVISKTTLKDDEIRVLGSDDRIKQFTYKNGVLSFEFTITGTTTTIHLTK